MGESIIKILDAVHCQANREARELIKNCLSYKTQVWKRGRFGRSQQTVLQYLITGRPGSTGLFYTGLLGRVLGFCNSKNISITFEGKLERIKATREPFLKGVVFREDQLEVFKTIKKKSRGTIIAPTGSGKTLVALGIMSMFPNCRILFLCHTLALIDQTRIELKKYNFKDVYIMGGSYNTNFKKLAFKESTIVLSTIQSFAKLNPVDYADYFDITIVDETHHLNKKSSQYGYVMENNLSPRRYGLTATEPTKQSEILTNEGLLGPKITELTISQGVKIGIIAKPKIKLLPVPFDIEINQRCRNRYTDFYQYAIVENKTRNGLIIKEVEAALRESKSILIIVERIEHGEILMELFNKKSIKADFVKGQTEPKEQEKIKTALKEKRKLVVICTKIWKEGINIPSLNKVVLAFGMKEEKGVIQTIGRGLRTTEKKKTVELIDFLDPYRFLAEHSILRMQVYASEGWI